MASAKQEYAKNMSHPAFTVPGDFTDFIAQGINPFDIDVRHLLRTANGKRRYAR